MQKPYSTKLMFLILLLTASAVVSAQNLVTNGTFDTDLAGWKISPWSDGTNLLSASVSATNPHEGAGCALLSVSSAVTTGNKAFDGRLETDYDNGVFLSLAANKVYKLSFWVRFEANAASGTARRLQYWIKDADSWNYALPNKIIDETEVEDGTWTQVEAYFSTYKTGADDYTLSFQAGRYAADYFIDQVEITEESAYYLWTPGNNVPTNAANWTVMPSGATAAAPPTANDIVVMASGNSMVIKNTHGPIQYKALLLEGSGVFIFAGGQLDVSQSFTNRTNSKFKTYADYQGVNPNFSLVNVNDDANATVTYKMAVSTGAQWYPYASGLSTDIGPEKTNKKDQTTGQLYFIKLAESAAGYEHEKTSLSAQKGYLSYSAAQKIRFETYGIAAGSTLRFEELMANNSNDGFHLLPNHFSMYVDLAKIKLPASHFEQNITVYDPETEDFIEKGLTGNLYPQSAFYVRATSDGGSVVIPRTAKTDGAAKKTKGSTQQIAITFSDDTYSDQATLCYQNLSVAEKDNYDITKLFSFKAGRLAVYSTIDNQPIAINSIPENFEGMVPITLRLGNSNTATLQLARNNFPENTQTALWIDGKRHAFDQDFSYSFSGKIGEEIPVQLEISKKTLALQPAASSAIKAVNNILYANWTGNEPAQLHVYNLQGGLVLQKTLTNQQTSLHLDKRSGVYLVKLKTADQLISKKVYIQ